MISIGEIKSIPYTFSVNNSKYTRFSYVLEFLNKKNKSQMILTTPECVLVSATNSNYIEKKIKGNFVSCTVKLNITDETIANSFYKSISDMEAEIYNLVRREYNYIQIFNKLSFVNGIENIQTKYEMKDDVYNCIREGKYIVCSISVIGCITLQNTFEIIYTLEKIENVNIVDEIYNILIQDRGLLKNIEDELYDKIKDELPEKEITICDITSVKEVEYLQNEINKLMNN
jgi:hypothetical protein